MNCRWMQSRLSAYHDGDLSAPIRFLARLHLQNCSACFEEAERRESVTDLASRMSPALAPKNLNLQLRLAVYNEMSRETWLIRTWRIVRAGMRDSVRPLAIRGLGGLVAGLLLFGAVMPDLWTVRAATADDVEVTYLARGLMSPPTISALAPNEVHGNVTVMALIGADGKLYGLEMPVELNEDRRLRADIANKLLFSTFEPATFFGRPIAGRLVITFSQHTVKG